MRNIMRNVLAKVAVALAALDPSFGNGGVVTFGYGFFGQAITTQADGKIVVAGGFDDSQNNRFAVERLLTDGSRDSTFGTNGEVPMPFSLDGNSASTVVIQSDGKIRVAGPPNIGNTNNRLTMIRFGSDGALDPSFGEGRVKKEIHYEST